MELINSSGPHFVRCINPNRNKQAQVFEDAKAVEQLRCGGVIEAMRMARAGFPCRFAHHEFARIYVPFLCPEVATGLPARSKCLACFKAMNSMPGHFAVGKTLVLMRREVLDEAERLRGAVLFNHAVTIQSAARALIALSLHSRRRRDHEDRKNISSCTCFLQAIVRRSRVRLQYIRRLGIVRATPGYQNFSLTKPTSQIVTAVVSSPSHTASTKASIKPTWQDLGLGDTESETGGEIEGSMTARSHLSGSSDTEPPFIGSEDESRMREGLLSMGIGEQAVGHVMWVAVSVGGMPSSSKLTLKGGDSDTALLHSRPGSSSGGWLGSVTSRSCAMGWVNRPPSSLDICEGILFFHFA